MIAELIVNASVERAETYRIIWPWYITYGIAAIVILLLVYNLFKFKIIFPTRAEHRKPKKAIKPKLLFVVLDGAADRPSKALEGRTPYEVASIPNINSIAKKGHVGLLHILKIAPESDEAVLALLGYDPKKYYTGRGVIEALGLGMPFKKGDLALRCNFACVKKGRLIDPRAGGLSTKENKELVSYLNKNLKLNVADFELKAGIGYRATLLVKSKKKLSSKITNTHPGYMKRGVMSIAVPYKEPLIEKCNPLDKSEEAMFTAALVNAFTEKARSLLDNHPVNRKRESEGKVPANFILLRDASVDMPYLPDINAKTGHNWAILADMPVEIGIGKLASMSIIKLPELSGNDKEDLGLKVKETLNALRRYDCLYVHLKGPDIFAHAGNGQGKIKSIESIDKFYFAPLLRKLDLEKTIICITSDHCTPFEKRVHSADPVPIAVYAPWIKGDGLTLREKIPKHFLSKIPKEGSFGRMKATHLVNYLMRLMRSTK